MRPLNQLFVFVYLQQNQAQVYRKQFFKNRNGKQRGDTEAVQHPGTLQKGVTHVLVLVWERKKQQEVACGVTELYSCQFDPLDLKNPLWVSACISICC